MEGVAIISDIHGNVPALEAVLAEIKRRNISRIFCLGDMVGKGPSPDIVIDICRKECEKIIKGNHEELICAETVFGGKIYEKMNEWHKEKLGKERYEYLLSLENCIDMQMGGKNIRLFHASQIGVCYRVRRGDSLERHLAMFENTDFTGDFFKPDVVVYGDIHLSYIEIVGNKILFNVGSVGNPLGMDTRASFGILTGEDKGKLELEVVKIDYDRKRAIDDTKNCGLPEIDLYVNEILTGKYRGKIHNT
ncbi:MAG: metallophosphatase family protein [Treponema sp.]|nr:metallophosphatase family protein [Treponema sp.]